MSHFGTMPRSTRRRPGNRTGGVGPAAGRAAATRNPYRGDSMAKAKPTVYQFIPKLGQLRDDVLFGDV
ncbi:MAG TPA: hypothetical protein VEL75_02890, partial [Candidatus Methylomirabilis sp.]|nr:hypothetical protein [Candidatus Methylomirabilis sp.]